MFVSRQPGPRPPVPPALLDIPGTADLGEAGSIDAEETPPGDVLAGPSSAVIDAGRIDGPLVVDGPHEGDRIRPLGMTGTKKLSDLLQEAGVPRRERAATPVVRNGRDVVWVAGVRMSEDYRVTASTTRAVRLSWRR